MISALQGLYISLLETRHALLVILDTEGLLSVEARDDVFDKQVALMTMACSDLVIVNNRGELGRKLGRIGDSSDRIVLKEVSVTPCVFLKGFCVVRHGLFMTDPLVSCFFVSNILP